jgi:hypothetical protein
LALGGMFGLTCFAAGEMGPELSDAYLGWIFAPVSNSNVDDVADANCTETPPLHPFTMDPWSPSVRVPRNRQVDRRRPQWT